MLHNAYYLIEARPQLVDWLAQWQDRDLAQILLEPVLLRSSEPDRSSWRETDHALRIKLLFVARLREYTPLQSDDSAIALLGSSTISVGLFDKWWSIRKLLLEDTTDSLRGFLKPVLGKLELTGNKVVDEWLDEEQRNS